MFLPGGSSGGSVEASNRIGIEGAEATVGPPLNSIAVRGYLAGHLSNSPDNMMKWIEHPQRIDPQVVMPEMGVTDQDARDISAYLYTLR